jgi:multicomponent K+:H+ antiporter subunit E
VKRVLPSPMLSLALLAAWLMLNETLSLGHVLLGSVLALLLPQLTVRWLPRPSRARHAGAVFGLARTVLVDIVRANFTVARLIIGDEANIQPRFIWVPLSLRDPFALALLSGIVTLTPGTLSSDLSKDHRYLLVHAFDVDDDAAEAALIDDIHQRYEAPLRRIFEGDSP